MRLSTLAAFAVCLFASLASSAGVSNKDWIPINGSMVSFDKLTGETFVLIADSDSTLYAGGTYGVLRWNGGFWKRIGGGFGEVHALAVDDKGNLYAGGNFPSLKNIVRWDGKIWSTMGTGTNGMVLALAVGSGGEVYAGGRFDSVGGARCKYVGKWNGNAWLTLDSGIIDKSVYPNADNGVNAFAMDKSGNLYAGGDFDFGGTSTSVAKWDGKKWFALGTFYNNADGITNGLAFDAQGNLYAAGFLLAVPTAADGYNFLVWDGASWRSAGGGVAQTVASLAADDAGNLYLGGAFGVGPGDSPTAGFAKYDPAAGWTVLDTSRSYRDTYPALAVDKAGKLFAGGRWRNFGAGGPYVIGLRPDTFRWLDVAARTDVNAIVVDYRNNIYVGGDLTTVGDVPVRNIAQWDGRQWKGLGHGIRGSSVNAIASDRNGNVYVGGTFDSAGTVAAKNIARWDGSAWSGLGSGVQGPLANGQPASVNALAFDAKGNLLVGGNFQSAGGASARNVAQWDGSSWTALGTGASGIVLAAAYRKRDNSIYFGGDFDDVGNTGSKNIGRWDGKAWFPVGSGLSGPFGDWVGAITIDSAGNVYVGGNFKSAGNSLAVWSGTNWSSPGGGFSSGATNGVVNSITLLNDTEFYAGGSFTSAGGTKASYVAKWDGSGWDSLGAGVNSFVHATALCDSFLYAGGFFDSAGGKYAPGFAKLNIKGTTTPPLVSRQSADGGAGYGIRVENSRLMLTGVKPDDHVRLYAVDGALLGAFQGASVIDLESLPRRLIIFRIYRSGRAAMSGILVLK